MNREHPGQSPDVRTPRGERECLCPPRPRPGRVSAPRAEELQASLHVAAGRGWEQRPHPGTGRKSPVPGFWLLAALKALAFQGNSCLGVSSHPAGDAAQCPVGTVDAVKWTTQNPRGQGWCDRRVSTRSRRGLGQGQRTSGPWGPRERDPLRARPWAAAVISPRPSERDSESEEGRLTLRLGRNGSRSPFPTSELPDL